MLRCLAVLAAAAAAVAAPSANTQAGLVVGYSNDLANVWSKIPFAAPPVGSLRWAPPQPVAPWKGALATVSGTRQRVQSFTRQRPTAAWSEVEAQYTLLHLLSFLTDPPGCPQSCDLPPHTCPTVQSGA